MDNKPRIFKRSRFLPCHMLLDLYFKIILPSVTYAWLIWGSFTNKDGFHALESLHCRAARLIYCFTRDMPSVDVLKEAKWDSLFSMYKVRLATLAYKFFNDCAPASMDHILVKNDRMYNLRNRNKVIVPRFNSYYMKNSIAHRASIVWNLLTPNLPVDYNVKNFTSMVTKSKALYNLDYGAESPQTTPHNNDNFIYY